MQIAGWMRRALCAALVVCLAAGSAAAQGVTTGSMGGVVTDAQGAVVPGATVIAIHEPSGTSYEAVTQADGRFAILGMRVGGPYKATAELTGFGTQTKDALSVNARDVDRHRVHAERRRGHRAGHGEGHQRRDVRLAAHGRRDRRHPRRAGAAADGVRPHQRHHPPDAAVQRQRVVRRRRQPHEQHHGRRVVLQQLVRSPGSAGRAHRRRADLARGHRADPGERRAV